MFEVFQKYITQKIDITLDEIELIKSVSTIKKLRKRQYLLQEGDLWKFNAFVCKGLVRTYSIGNKGQEYILNFGAESHWTGDRESLMTGNASLSKNLQTN
jgi:CRP-like cAMP-binding protein